MSKHQHDHTQATSQQPVTPVVETSTITTTPEEKVPETKPVVAEKTHVKDIADIIGVYLPAVMRDRAAISVLLKRGDQFVETTRGANDFTDLATKQKVAKEVLDQLTNGRLAIEALMQRIRPILEA